MPCLAWWLYDWFGFYLDLFALFRISVKLRLITIIESGDAEGQPQDPEEKPENAEQGKSPLIMLNPDLWKCKCFTISQIAFKCLLFIQMQLFSAIDYSYLLDIMPSNCLPHTLINLGLYRVPSQIWHVAG